MGEGQRSFEVSPSWTVLLTASQPITASPPLDSDHSEKPPLAAHFRLVTSSDITVGRAGAQDRLCGGQPPRSALNELTPPRLANVHGQALTRGLDHEPRTSIDKSRVSTESSDFARVSERSADRQPCRIPARPSQPSPVWLSLWDHAPETVTRPRRPE